MPLPERVDLLVVGAGTAGAAAAGRAAARGLRVLCVDRGPLDAAGAHWRNGVTREAFVEAAVPLPEGDELAGDDVAFHMHAGWGPTRITMRRHGVLEIDMRHLVDRLQRRALEAGAILESEVTVEGLEGTRVRTSRGTVRAEAIADASGLGGARLLDQPRTPRRDLCAAAQAVFRLADPAGADLFLDQHRAQRDEVLCFAGVAGGYSILNVRIRDDEVALLTGSIPADGHPSGGQLIDRFVQEHPWIGAEVLRGQRAIPLGRPHDVIGAGRVALLGDAARQVFSAHGSGIGPGMLAARILADTLAEGGSAEDYAVTWMRTHGGLFAAYDAFRRYSQGLSTSSLERLMEVGLVDGEMSAATMAQRLPRLTARDALGLAPGLAKAGRLSVGLAQVGARMGALQALYRAYPRERRARRGWAATAARLARGD
ncbi:MAG: FAD-binding protein [Sandaracinaceae bacterium]